MCIRDRSTLIGHILYDSKLLYADQEKALLLDSKVGSRGGAIDYSLLLDVASGQAAEELRLFKNGAALSKRILWKQAT